MRVVAFEREILVLEVEQVLHRGIDAHRSQFARLARELFARLVEVIKVKVGIAEGVDEIAELESADLRDHHRQQRIRSDVERHAEENIGAALIKLAREFGVSDVKLEKRMAWHQRHLVEVADVPC